jgi:protein-S-isoprenylcysteine O-methyltransferase Ste14
MPVWRLVVRFVLGIAVTAAALFLPAWTFDYWQAWVLLAVLFVPFAFVGAYFMKRSPEFLARRMQYKEKRGSQQWFVAASGFLFALAFLMPGMDVRLGWSVVPTWLVLLADIVVLVSYALVFAAFRANAYAARTVEVMAGQKVIDTGPYAIVRHPMYAGIIPMLLVIPLALGSFWALIPVVLACALIIPRLLDEERLLRSSLPGYAEYCTRVKFRLIPRVW